MDAQIRRLLTTGAEQHNVQLLTEAFQKIKQNFQVNLVQSKDSIGQDIYVLLAENALDLNINLIVDECLQMFFSSSPVKSQFVGRAYLCQFRMYMPKTAQEYASLNNAIPFLQKCLTFSSSSTRYQFLVYNASIIYFNYIRPFFRDGYRKYLCDSFQLVVDTLMNVPDEKDFAWEAQLLFELVRCYMDANNMNKARDTSDRLLQLCQTQQLPLLSNVLQFLIVNHVVEYDKLSVYASSNDPSSTFNRFLMDLALVHRKILDKSATNENLKSIFDRIIALPARSAMTANKSIKVGSSHDLNSSRLEKTLTSYEKHRLLVEVGRLSLLIRYTDLTKVTLDELANIRLKEPEHLLEVRLIQAEYMVRNLAENEETYNKSVVDTRIRAIELTEETIESLVRTGKYELVQTGCIVLWNLCLPLLQTNLRGRIRKPLTTLVHILERIQSLNWLVRSQAHFELAKIEEDIEQLDSAKTNLLKAKQLDDTSIYVSRINLALERLQLRSELYKIPDDVDDRVGIIIEQAGKSTSGNKNKQRALLIEACTLLAQDAFQVVLDSENPNAIGKMRANPTAQLKGFADHYEKCIQNTVHYEQLMPETDQDKRLKLWADLTSIARKQEIWDVCRTAARFCLLYDNEQRRSKLNGTDQSSKINIFQRDLLRILAEVHFIAGEAEIEFIRERRIQLFDIPVRPPMPTVPAAQRAQLQLESDNDWRHYCQWLQQLSVRVCMHFSTGAVIGQLLNESWLICRAGEYIWNYTRHLFYSNRLRLLLEPLSTIVSKLRKVGYDREILLMVNLCVALSNAYITPLPLVSDENRSPSKTETSPIPQQAPSTTKKPGKTDQQTISATNLSPDISANVVKNEDLKAAIEICEYAINQTNEQVAKHLSISIRDRQTLLQLWVTIKQQLQQSIKSSVTHILGDDDDNPSSLNTLSRAVITVDTLSRLDSGWNEGKDCLNLKQAVTFVDECRWNDSLVELQMWCRLGIVANRAHDVEITYYCRNKALELITPFQTRKIEKFQLSLANEYVSRACGAHAECLLKQQTGQKQERKEVLGILVEAASYSAKADLYELTMHLAKHFWNTCRLSIKRKLERSLLFDLLNEIIHHINTVAPKSIVASFNDKDEPKDDSKLSANEGFKPKKQPLTNKKDKKVNPVEDEQAQTTSLTSSAVEDAQIRSALYGVLVQIYMDKHSWHSALDAIDSALQVLPRTQHRLLLYKYRVLIKSKLGLSISMDMQKFREQGELALAKMWRQVAVMAKKKEHVISGYQQAISTLQSFENYWTKIDYILELSSWLYSNEYLLDNIIDLIEWAIDLLLTSDDAYKQQETNNPDGSDSTSSKRLSFIVGGSTKDVSTEKERKTSDSQQTQVGSVKPKAPNRLLPDLSINEVTQVRRLEYLCRCHILLAFMARPNQSGYELILQKTYWLLMKLWQRGLADSADINKDVEAELAAAEAAASNVESGKKQKGAAAADPKKKQPPPPPTGKTADSKQGTNPKSATSDASIPKTVSEWATFVPSDEILQTYTLPQAKQRGFNKNTISKPLLSFYYLDVFVRLLREYGYNHMSLPVLSFMRLISQILIRSSSVRTYVLLRTQQVCQELNLLESMQTVSQLARPFTIRDDDLSISRAEMILYTKLLAQQREEESQLESAIGSSALKSETRSYGTSAYSSRTSREKALDSKSLVADLPGDKQTLNKLITRNIWLKTANLLFELNLIQESKDILQEILVQAKAYEDQTCEKRAYILLGEIALHEERFDQAFELAMQGQQIPIDEHDWYRSVVTAIEALRQDKNQDTYKQKKVQSILDTAIQRLESIAQLHINKVPSIIYAASILNNKKIEIDFNNILNQSNINTISNRSIFYRLQDILQRCDISFTNMLNLQRYNDACQIILTRSISILKRYAHDSNDENDRKQYFYRALVTLEQLTDILAQRWYSIRKLLTQSDLITIQLPIQRQFVGVQLEIISILIELSKIHANEMYKERLRRKNANTTYLAVEDFVKIDKETEENLDHNTDNIQWNEFIKILPDKLITSVMAILEIVGTYDRLTKSKLLYYLAQVYYIFGQNFGTDYPLEWNLRIKDILGKINELQSEKPGTKRIGSQTSGGQNSANPVDNEVMTEEALITFAKHKIELNQSMAYLGQSMECALQSLNISLVIQDKMLIRDTSLLLCETIGQFDPISSIIYLSLSQNANAAIYAEHVLKRTCHIPTDSELASLFKLIDRLKQNEIVTNSNNGLLYRTIVDRLKTYWSSRYMTIRTQYYDLTKDMPASFNFLILYYSSNGDTLYAALFNSKMIAGKGTPAAGASKQANAKSSGSTNGSVNPQIMRIEVNKKQLIKLLDKYDQWKQEYAQLLQRYDIKLQHNREKQSILNSEQFDPVDISTIDELKQRFLDEFLVELNEYFAPISPLLSNYLDPEKQYESRSLISPDHLILLIDPRLAHLPLEALEIFKHVQIGGISRDFSIQSVYNRLNANAGLDEPANPADESKNKKATAKETGEVVNELQTVDSGNTYYITHPALLKSTTESKVLTPFDTLRQRFPQLISKWKTIKQDGTTINSVEVERIISDAQGVIYYGTDTLSELVGSYKCPTLSKNGCTILCSFDRTSTSLTSISELCTVDSEAIQLDRSTEIALLWSMGGVKSILLNQWKSTINENETILFNTFSDIATLRCSLSQAMRLYVYPYFRPVEVDSAATKDSKGKANTPSNKKNRSPSPTKAKGQGQASAVTDKSKTKKSSETHQSETIPEQPEIQEPIPERPRPALQLQQLNTVIFGLPNLTFAP